MVTTNDPAAVLRGPDDAHSPRLNFDIPDALLAEVDFKWLMAGLGWQIDMARLGDDPVYAARLLDWARNSDSPALRECAATLLAHIDSAGTSRHDHGD